MPWSGPRHNVRFAVAHADGRTTLRVAGELDVASVRALTRELPGDREWRRSREIVLDLSRVTFCAAAGVDLLLALYHQVTTAGGDLVIRSAHSAVLRTVHLSREPTLMRLLRSCGPVRTRVRRAHHTLLREALAMSLRMTGAPMGNAQVPADGAGGLHIVAHRGFGRPFLSFFETVTDRESACALAAQDQRPVFIEDVSASPTFLGTPSLDVLDEARVGAVASLPVVAPSGAFLGVVSVHHHRPTSWTAQERLGLDGLARSVGRLAP